MSRARTVVLDDEAVQALADPRHRKHRSALAIVALVELRVSVADAHLAAVLATTSAPHDVA